MTYLRLLVMVLSLLLLHEIAADPLADLYACGTDTCCAQIDGLLEGGR